ncbi:hypothetical protein DM01DRAFT_1095390 [Hesseltinella vesiculosa]|uniref:Uncharacterized protein n=1 Tax=Hesseltinella vesiculosa TaxID=101127 RepID=A0A1X2GCD0_9FUNG|nr:hypothetical protein DM01DRAFT_1095390 [Hesseltinella vesiculosa]
MATDTQLCQSWSDSLGAFFTTLGMEETQRCFAMESLVLSNYHQSQLPGALECLADHLLQALERHARAKESLTRDNHSESEDLLYHPQEKRRRIDENEPQDNDDLISEDVAIDNDGMYKKRARQLDPDQVQVRASNSEVQQRITNFIQTKRKDVDASNRAEFLNRPDPQEGEEVTCARVDAKEINRNIQMKLDVIENEDDPLARSTTTDKQRQAAAAAALVQPAAQADPAMELVKERLDNLEQHLHIKFEQHPDRPFTAMERIKIIENTIIDIENKYPLWASVHFNQPNRTYPPPPPVTFITRPTPTSKPSTPTDAPTSFSRPATPNADYVPSQIIIQPMAAPTSGRSNSSLTRAVLNQMNRMQSSES